jgi:hypothetical protein
VAKTAHYEIDNGLTHLDRTLLEAMLSRVSHGRKVHVDEDQQPCHTKAQSEGAQ